MKKLTVFALALLLSAALAAPAISAEDNALIPPASKQRKANQGQSLKQGPIPKAQLEQMKKRDQAIKQRNKAMKMRLKTMKDAQRGNTAGDQTLPAPPQKQ